MKKEETWIVVANGTQARFFRVENNHTLVELDAFIHPASHLHDRDLVSDRPGRGFESANPTRHALESKTTPKGQEFILFARQICEHLNHSHSTGGFHKLYLAANPSFLGLLRDGLSKSTTQAVAGEIDKDLTHVELQKIRDHFPYVL